MNKKHPYINLIIILLSLCLLITSIYLIMFLQGKKIELPKNESEIKRNIKNTFIEEIKYNFDLCLQQGFNDKMKSEKMLALENEIREYANNYSLSYRFNTLNNDYYQEHKPNTIYFGASLYKLLNLIYLIELENAGNINLDDEVKYTTDYYVNYSKGMKNIKNNSLISLRELLSYSISYSDNTAHKLLTSYIGKDKLRELGRSLGAENIMNEHGYGQANVNEIYLYLNKVYELISLNNQNSDFIKENMNNDYYNSINVPEISYYHKWGGSDVYYHDIGIAIDNNYMIIIMSKLRLQNYTEVFNNLSKYFYELNFELENSKLSYCYNLYFQ